MIEHFLPAINAKTGRGIQEVPSGVLRALEAYSWPGNVRQLQNLLEESVVISTGDVLHLPAHFGSERPASRARALKTLAQAERDFITEVLAETESQIAGPGGAAEILDFHPNTLRSRMKKLGISVKELVSS